MAYHKCTESEFSEKEPGNVLVFNKVLRSVLQWNELEKYCYKLCGYIKKIINPVRKKT